MENLIEEQDILHCSLKTLLMTFYSVEICGYLNFNIMTDFRKFSKENMFS